MQKILVGFLFFLMFFVFSAFSIHRATLEAYEKSGVLFFKGTWAEALQKAKVENKIVFLDIYATWCGPCKKLKNKTFANVKVAKYFNENFINVMLDGEEDKDGIMLSEKLNLSAYPSLYFINAEGKVIKAAEGYYNPSELLRLAKSIK